MIEQLTEHFAQRLTREQKRSTKPILVAAMDVHSDQSMAPVPPRDPQDLYKAQLNLADMALAQPDPEAWLRDVLDALALRAEIWDRVRKEQMVCWPYTGTSRGLNTHFRTSTRVCGSCESIRQERYAARMSALSLDPEGIINERG